MSGKLLDRVPTWTRGGEIAIFDDHVEVRGDTAYSWRYEEIRSVRLERNPIGRQLSIKNNAGETVSVLMVWDDGLRARRIIEDNRRRIKQLRELGYEGLEDFEAETAAKAEQFRRRFLM
jgi:hypothetical protein